MNKQILYFYNPRCGHCNAFDNASKDFFRDNINTNKDIKLIKFSSEDIKNRKVDLDQKILYILKGTPIFLFIENGTLHEKRTVIGNNLEAFKISFNIFMKVNENIESKATIKAEGICTKVHKIETNTEAPKPTFGEHKSEPVKATTCGAHKSEPVKTTTTCGAHKSETVKPTTTCGAHKSDPVKTTTTCGAHKSEPVKTTCGAHKSEPVKTTCGANKLKSDK